MFLNIKRKIKLLFLIGVIASVLIGCGNSTQSESKQVSESDTGSVAFQIVFEPNPDAESNLQGRAFSSCHDINTVTAQVFDSTGRELSDLMRWDCTARQGTISRIQNGVNRQIIVQGLWVETGGQKTLLYEGTETGLTIRAGETTHVESLVVEFQAPDDPDQLDALLGSADQDDDNYTTIEGDCDDSNPDRHPLAEEICNGIDENCNGMADEPYQIFYVDADGDGYGSETSIEACAIGVNLADNSTDCDDSNSAAHPEAEETDIEAYDSIDQDCVGGDLTDVDGDGFDSIVVGGRDVDDNDPNVNPNVAEVCLDGIDNNSNGVIDEECPWNKIYGSSQSDIARSVVQGNDFGYVFAGRATFDRPQYNDVWIVKVDEDGNEVDDWNFTFGDSSYENANEIIQCNDGGYVVAGSISLGSSQGDAWILKIDENGAPIEGWPKIYTGGFGASAIVQGNSGGYVFIGGGMDYSKPTPSDDIWVVKIDEDGTELFNIILDGDFADYPTSVIQGNDGGYIVTGQKWLAGLGEVAWIVKIAEDGSTAWSNTIEHSGGGRVYSITPSNDNGGYVFAGMTGGDAWLVKIDNNGDEVPGWNKLFGGTGTNYAYSVVQANDSGYVFTGITSLSVGGYDLFLRKVDENGDEVEGWYKTYGDVDSDYASCIIQGNNYGYVTAGYSRSYEVETSRAWLLKIDEAGNTPDFP